jgi:hypothetical protein
MPISLHEHGFWDYTAPGAGGMEGYTRDDYSALLDDMSASGMNSVLVMPKWITTGYRSRLPFVDQHPSNPVTGSDNVLLRDFLNDAKRRGIKTWIGAVASMFPARCVASAPYSFYDGSQWGASIEKIGCYDLDTPEVNEFAQPLFEELYELFPAIDGFMVELEFAAHVMPHRAPLYNAWAEANRRPRFDSLFMKLDGRSMTSLSPWREYSTHRRTELLAKIEKALRARGFRGELAMLCETGRSPGIAVQEVDCELFRRRCPNWAAVSYEYAYDKDTPCRLGMMEMAITLPRKAGLKTYYLPRGVMTFNGTWPMTIPLEETWRRECEDIVQFMPDGVWWFGSGQGANNGWHVDTGRLKQSGFADGRAARNALLRATREAGLRVSPRA